MAETTAVAMLLVVETTAVATLPAVATAVAAKAATRLPRKSKEPCILRYEHLQAHPERDAPVCFCTDKRTNPGNSKIEAPGKKPSLPKRKKKKGENKKSPQIVEFAGIAFLNRSVHLAEREGFEPPEPCGSTVFETATIDHSAISPTRGAKVKIISRARKKIRPLFFFSKTKSPALSLSARRHPGSR